MDVKKDTKEKISQLQLLEQKISTLVAQKQQFQQQLMEVESALAESKSSEKTYKIIGNIMVLSDKEKIQKDLESKKEILELRLTSLDKQEDKNRIKAKEIQTEVLKEMKNDK